MNANRMRGCSDVKGRLKHKQTWITAYIIPEPFALIEPAWHSVVQHLFNSAEQSEENEISKQGCGQPVIRFHHPAVSTGGHRVCPPSCLSPSCPVS